MSTGIRMAIKYTIVPCELKQCGPENDEERKRLINALLKFLSGKKIKKEIIKEALLIFKDAFENYKCIARNSHIADPLDKKVVEAYWIGNKLLKAGGHHHSFAVYKEDDLDLTSDKIKDICRVSWGKIILIKGNQLSIQYKPIVKEGGKWVLGHAEEKLINWNKKLIPKIKIGKAVSIHWNTAIEILNKKKLDNLIKYTLLSIK